MPCPTSDKHTDITACLSSCIIHCPACSTQHNATQPTHPNLPQLLTAQLLATISAADCPCNSPGQHGRQVVSCPHTCPQRCDHNRHGIAVKHQVAPRFSCWSASYLTQWHVNDAFNQWMTTQLLDLLSGSSWPDQVQQPCAPTSSRRRLTGGFKLPVDEAAQLLDLTLKGPGWPVEVKAHAALGSILQEGTAILHTRLAHTA